MTDRNPPEPDTAARPDPAFLERQFERARPLFLGSLLEPLAAHDYRWTHESLVCYGVGEVSRPRPHPAKGADNLIFLGSGTPSFDQIHVNGSRNVVVVGPHCPIAGAILQVFGDDCIVTIGGFTTIGERAFVQVFGAGSSVVIGERCWFGDAAVVSNSDTHGIYDRTTGQRINQERNVRIGQHVFLGYDARVGKGTEIGDGAVFLDRAVLTGSYPGGRLYHGVPASHRGEEIDWSIFAADHPTFAEAAAAEQRFIAERSADVVEALAARGLSPA